MDFNESRAQWHDFVYMAARFKAPTSKLVDLLPTTKLHPVESTKGLTLVRICAFEYKKFKYE
jgi:hypothetical protein